MSAWTPSDLGRFTAPNVIKPSASGQNPHDLWQVRRNIGRNQDQRQRSKRQSGADFLGVAAHRSEQDQSRRRREKFQSRRHRDQDHRKEPQDPPRIEQTRHDRHKQNENQQVVVRAVDPQQHRRRTYNRGIPPHLISTLRTQTADSRRQKSHRKRPPDSEDLRLPEADAMEFQPPRRIDMRPVEIVQRVGHVGIESAGHGVVRREDRKRIEEPNAIVVDTHIRKRRRPERKTAKPRRHNGDQRPAKFWR